MIEINLLPGSAKRSRRRMPKLAMGGLGKAKLPNFNQGLAIMVGAWVIGLGLLAWMFLGGRNQLATLDEQIAAARLDSVRLAQTINTADTLQRRMAAVAGKLEVVQQIDASRYVWAHLLDEAARALPEHTWMTEINNIAVDSGVMNPKFSIEGRTGNNLALAQYLAQLEQSPFIRNVRLRDSQLVREDDKLVYSFLLEADYEPPPPDVIETVPLFTPGTEPDSANTTPQRGTTAPQRGGQPQRAGTPRTQEQR
ncbi:MAG: PilN domain-containing protein [Gemmatimonadota bacterium]